MLKKYEYSKIPLYKDYYLVIFEEEYIPEVTAFVAQRYYNQEHYKFNCSLNELIHDMTEHDKELSSHSITFCLIDSNDELCCTSRLIKRKNPLPFEDEFEVDLDLFTDKVSYIYEFARFASNGNISFLMIERMFKYMLQSVEPNQTLVVASLDKKVFSKLSRIKYPIYRLGLPIHYLGSSTVPIGIKLSELPLCRFKKIMEEIL